MLPFQAGNMLAVVGQAWPGQYAGGMRLVCVYEPPDAAQALFDLVCKGGARLDCNCARAGHDIVPELNTAIS